MENNLNWSGETLLLDSNKKFDKKVIMSIKSKDISFRKYEYEPTQYQLPNQKIFFIFEDEFIDQSKNIVSIINKLSRKDYADKIGKYCVTNNEFEYFTLDSSDKDIYNQVVSNNIIDGPVTKFNVSINILQKLLKQNKKSTLIIDVFILFSIANKTYYNAESMEFKFTSTDKVFTQELNILSSEPLRLWMIYDWIFNHLEYKDSYVIKLEIVRQVILEKQTFKDVGGIVSHCQLIYKRIISQKTDAYFEQLNRLTDDFLVLSKNQQTAVRTLNLTFFAWLGTLSMEILRIVIEYQGTDLWRYLLLSKGQKKTIVILLFVVALLSIWFAYVMELSVLSHEYTTIHDLYVDKILFDRENVRDGKILNKIIKKPSIDPLQKKIFYILLFGLIIRLIISMI